MSKLRNKIISLFAIFLITPILFVSAGQISVGIHSKDILVWRYWENIDGKATEKAIILNKGVSDTEISVDVVKIYSPSPKTTALGTKADEAFGKVGGAVENKFKKLC